MAYPDSILRRLARPGRYTGCEWNSITKDWQTTGIRVALAYPDVYEIGMSNMALPILYDILNSQPDILAERVFAPWLDMEAALREENIPLLSLESSRPLSHFDILGFSLGYELTYTNVLNMLDLAGIPVLAGERDESHPLVIAGGSCALNPEPMSDFIDLFVIGEAEDIILRLIEVCRKWKTGRGNKEELLGDMTCLPGIYVPSLYKADYHSDGTLAGITPSSPKAQPSIRRCIVDELPPAVTKPVVPFIEAIHDRAAVEIQRGCARGCRFCQAGAIYRPRRHRSQEEVADAVGQLVSNCGYNEVSLVSLSTSDYPGINSLVRTIIERQKGVPLTISLPSLRIDNFSIGLMNAIHSAKKPRLTFAPEAGTERLRSAINKAVSEEDILSTIDKALEKGWTGFKLYFLIGLPTETREDIEGIGLLVNKIRRLKKKNKPRIKLSVSTFVPKAHTPFQWVAQDNEGELHLKYEILRQDLHGIKIPISWEDTKSNLLETVLSRGDRRLGRVIKRAWELGCTFDAWSERFTFDKWQQAFDEAGLDPAFYAYRWRPLDEILPWSHIDIGVSPFFLKQEYERTFQGLETPDCSQGKCNTCGLEKWQQHCRQKFQGK